MPAPTRPAPKPRVDVDHIKQRSLDRAAVIDQREIIAELVAGVNQYMPVTQTSQEAGVSADAGPNNRDTDEDQDRCTSLLSKTREEKGASGMVCFRAPRGATPEQVDQLKDHIAALNAIPNYWSPTGRVSPSKEWVMGSKGKLERLSKVATDIKDKHVREVEGTPYAYGGGVVAGHLPDTTWSGKKSPHCWHQHDGRVNSFVGAYATKYKEGYRPTGFYYGGIEDDPTTYTTERPTGTVSVGQYGICQITRP